MMTQSDLAAFFPSAEMKKNLALMHQRKHDGTLIGRDHLLHRSLVVEGAEVKDILNSGGGGAFAKPSDYARKLHHKVDRRPLMLDRDYRNTAQ